MSDNTPDEKQIPYGYCQCGCGQKTKVIAQDHPQKGHVKGRPFKYIHGHNRRRSVADVIKEYTDRENKSGCWIWTAAVNNKGYGIMTTRRERGLAHRVSWEYHNGKIPQGLQVLHKCDNPPCVNPDHLFLGTQKDNVHDMYQKGRAITGELFHLAKLTTSDVRSIRRLIEEGISQRTIAKRFSVSRGTISDIAMSRTWRHIG